MYIIPGGTAPANLYKDGTDTLQKDLFDLIIGPSVYFGASSFPKGMYPPLPPLIPQTEIKNNKTSATYRSGGRAARSRGTSSSGRSTTAAATLRPSRIRPCWSRMCAGLSARSRARRGRGCCSLGSVVVVVVVVRWYELRFVLVYCVVSGNKMDG